MPEGICGILSSCSAQLAAKGATGITVVGTLCSRALLVLVGGAKMYPESVRRIQFYLGAAEGIALQLSCFSNLDTFFFFFFPTSLCNPCFKALKARDYSGNAKTGWHIVAFADSRRKGCKSFVPDSLIFSLYSNYSHWEKNQSHAANFSTNYTTSGFGPASPYTRQCNEIRWA